MRKIKIVSDINTIKSRPAREKIVLMKLIVNGVNNGYKLVRTGNLRQVLNPLMKE